MNLDQLLERTLSLADEGDWTEVASMLADHLEEFEEEAALHCWLGVAERELGLDGVAYERFKRALALGPDDPYVLATAGNGIAAFDDPEAEQALRTAALTAPTVVLGRLLYGAYLAREGLFEEATRELAAARELEPDDPEVLYECGALEALQGRYDRAADSIGDSVRFDPDNGWIRTVFGLVLLEDGRLEEAVGELIDGARLREDDVDAQIAAALAASATGMDGMAYEMLERARMRAVEADLVLVTAVEDRLEAGPEAAEQMLMEEVAPGLLRDRLHERP